MPEAFHPGPFEIEHIVPKKHRGGEELANLAFACLRCNRHKGTNLAGIDPQTQKLARLFNPRRQKWETHFRWEGPVLIGRTRVGRATIDVLEMNADERIALRETLISEGVFPE